MEKFGTEEAESKRKVLSEEDMKTSEMVRKGTRPLNPGYEVALPWKKNPRITELTSWEPKRNWCCSKEKWKIKANYKIGLRTKE